jgi:glycosyltransferase involved in cell wall biosynthesis
VRISIVTVCLNQADTLDAAIQSVLDQGSAITHGQAKECLPMPPLDLEYIIVDGGSTDGSVEIIRRYADRLAWWVSEPDRGQSHALNKGFARATGEIVGWLNADDLLLPGALVAAQATFADGSIDVLCGRCRYEFADGSSRLMGLSHRQLDLLDVYDPIHQPSCFWRRELHRRVGGLDEGLHYGMDWDLWLRLREAGARFGITDDVLSVYRMTSVNKTSTGAERRNRELYQLLRRHADGSIGRLLAGLGYRALWPLKRLRRCSPRWVCRPVSDLARTTALVTLGPMLGFDRVRCCTHPFS